MTIHRVSLVLYLSVLAFVAAPAAADGEHRSARFLPAIEGLTPLYEEAAGLDQIPGVSVAVAFEGRLVWAQGFGHARVEDKIPMSPRHRLRVGSISKLLTAAALMRLYEQGRIDLEATVRGLVPSWPEKQAPITLRQLAGHQGGVRHYASREEFLSNRPYATIAGSLEIFRDDPLLFAPGSAVHYSTYGWTLLSAAIEQAAGQDFLSLVKAEVLVPLGLEDTMADRKGAEIARRAGLYGLEEGRLVPAPEVDNSNKWAGGGFLSTPSDLARFALAHTGPGYLEADTLELMFTPQTTRDGMVTYYGIGWQIGFGRYLDSLERRLPEQTREVGRRIMESYPFTVMHSGSAIGGSSTLVLSRRRRVAVAVAVNSSQGLGFPLLLALHTYDAFIQNAAADPGF